MAVSKQARKRAVAAGVVMATALMAGTFPGPVRAAAELHAAFGPSPNPQTSGTSADGLTTPGPLVLVAGVLIVSIASVVQNGLKIKLF